MRVLGGGEHVRLRGVDDHHAAPVAASTSTLSSPMPARPTTTSSSAASSTSALTCVALRITSAGAPPHGVEQLFGREAEADVDLEPGGAHGLEPAVGELLADQDALHRAEARRGSGRDPERFSR